MFLDLKKTSFLKKSDAKEVDVTVCYYPLGENKVRYVFFFYDPTEKTPIHKWAYYLIDNDYKDLRKKYKALLKEKNYKPNRLATLCMCNKTTKINTVKLPKSIKYSMKYKSIIKDDLVEKMGSDVKAKYFIDNKLEGAEEKKAERIEKKVMAEAGRRKAIVNRYKSKVAQEEYEYNYEANKEKIPLLKIFDWYYIGAVILIIAFALAMSPLTLLNFSKYYYFFSYAGVCLLFIASVFIIETIKKKKGLKHDKFISIKPITYKKVLDFYYILSSVLFLYGSEIFFYLLFIRDVSDTAKNVYGVLVFLYVLSIAIIERLKRKKLSKLEVEIKRKPKEEKIQVYQVEEDEDDEELFEGGMNENKLFNMSKSKVKITKSKKTRSVMTYRQLLVPKEEYKSAHKVVSVLGLGIKTLRTLPSLIASFHRKYSKGVNEIVAYNEAGFTLLVGFVNDQIVESMFIEGSEHTRVGEGNYVGFHLSSFRNVYSSLLWACQRETSNMDRVVYISNTEKNIEEFKKENLFGLPYEVVPTTDIVFGESVRKVKSMALFRAAFTLVETVVAIAIFSITASMVATLVLFINRTNRNMNDIAKASMYVKNIAEVINGDQSSDTFKTITASSSDEKFNAGNTSFEDHYFVDSNFSVFAPSSRQANMTYRVDFKFEKNKYEKSSGNTQDFYKYVFTIKKITRINEKKEIVSKTSFEVVR